MRGFFLCNKASGMSSARFLSHVQQILRPSKIGHGGTLDPFASGLLFVACGREYTKNLDAILNKGVKKYYVSIVLGARSSSYDRTGVIVQKLFAATPSFEMVFDAIDHVAQQQFQTPPPVSAIKVNGVRAYTLARRGVEVVLAPKETHVRNYMVLDCAIYKGKVILHMVLEVTSGFYIRSFAHDIGVQCGSDGYVTELVRYGIDDFVLSRSLLLKDLEKNYYGLHCEFKGAVDNADFLQYIQSRAQKYSIEYHIDVTAHTTMVLTTNGAGDVLDLFLKDINQGLPVTFGVVCSLSFFCKPQ